jgi:hypothetical protein
MIVLSSPVTPAAEAAAQAYAERTGTCIQEALAAAGSFAYCHCSGCMEQAEAEAAGETWAEGAYLRWAEGGWDTSGHGYQEDCPCC